MASNRAPPKAMFRPSLSEVGKLKCEAMEFTCTHAGIPMMGWDNRHFLDAHLWQLLRERNPDLRELVRPHPPCLKVLIGVCDDLTVIGMLKTDMLVQGCIHERWTKEDALSGLSVSHALLKHVLVVGNMPVPFHLSTSSSRLWGLVMPRIQSRGSRVFIREKYQELFPSRYHSHPYWNPPGDGVTSPIRVLLPPIMYPQNEFYQYESSLNICKEEDSERGERDAHATRNGFDPVETGMEGVVETWEHLDKETEVNYTPSQDHQIITMDRSTQETQIEREEVGGTEGMEDTFKVLDYVSQTYH